MSEYTFYSAFPGSRPVRCSEKTRRFAWDSLHAVYGRQTSETLALESDEIPGFAEMSPYARYDAAIRLIAEKAPLRLCPDELVCGSATLGKAIKHTIPVHLNGKCFQESVSHLTCGFDRVLREGLDSYLDRIHARQAKECTPAQEEFLRSLENTVESLRIWHGRYLNLLAEKRASAADEAERAYYDALYKNLAPVPFGVPKTFRQGVQALWFLFAFTRLCGNWSGIGRIDVMLGDLLKADLASGEIALDEARELLAHFWIKGCEWICLDERGTGDAQHYQNIVLSGCGEDGKDVTNEVTWLVLDIVEEFPIPDFPIAVRVNEDTAPALLNKIAAVMRHGSGVVAVYNERLIIDSMVEFGYPVEEARRFANDGCWEVQVPGKTLFGYQAIDIYGQYQKEVLGMEGEKKDYDSFDALLGETKSMIARFMADWHDRADSHGKGGKPSTVVALFEDDCIEKAADYYCGGTRYAALSPHLGGVPDTVNSLLAIKKLVFEEKKLTFGAFMDILRADWEGHEELRRYVRDSYTYYGNDNDEADDLAVQIMDTFMDETRKIKFRAGVLRPAGISTFGRQIDWKDVRYPHAHGYRRGEILASNLSPTPGTDREGATAVIRSHCKINLSKLTCGTALDIKLEPNSVKGEEGLEAIASLISGFVVLGGFFMQLDVMDNAVLLEAQKHPEDYQNLAVRISGWSARFVTLNDTWQRMIIERSQQAGV
ncbi:MAG: hypothetical protein IJ493_12805 [Clostridia bacterium]|nr:hypothetical protein [Clostridia bacterium]